MLVRVTGVIVERETELAALGEAIARGGVLVVAGPPGIGKSTLLRAAVSGAAQDGTRVLVAAGTPLERGFAFGTARALLEAPVASLPPAERAALLAGAARHALPVLEPGAAEAGPGDLHRTLHGLHWLVAGLAATASACASSGTTPAARSSSASSRTSSGLPPVRAAHARANAGSGSAPRTSASTSATPSGDSASGRRAPALSSESSGATPVGPPSWRIPRSTVTGRPSRRGAR